MNDNSSKYIIIGFIALFIAAVILGIFIGSGTSSSVGGYSIFDFLTGGGGSGGGGGGSVNGSNQTVIYQGVLNMLNSCSLRWGSVLQNCNSFCTILNKVCINSFAYYSDNGDQFVAPIPCALPATGEPSAVQCMCCSVPGVAETYKPRYNGACSDIRGVANFNNEQDCMNHCRPLCDSACSSFEGCGCGSEYCNGLTCIFTCAPGTGGSVILP
jgi:hypothetical protein